ncbi:MAG: transglycosylase SLT domain-containing protein [Candidatus Alcyoniella australis]|nr:transglycosylase SLT domain-containing protein [Candidatus Alcyoniella australis]
MQYKQLTLCLIVALAVALCAPGCKLFEPREVGIDLPDAAPEPIVEPRDPELQLHELLAGAAQHAEVGRELMEQGQPDEGRIELEQAFIMLGKALEQGTSDEQLLVDWDKLLLDVCTDMLRVNVVVGGAGPKLGDRIPLDFVYNPDVESWILYFLTNGRRSMSTWLERAAEHRQTIERILVEEGLPRELAALPIIESGYSTHAVSPAGATGLWQFIRSTGRNYGLRRSSWIDERRDPAKATRAACQYLKFLNNRFQSWPLALAGYNCGEGCIDRAIAAKGSRDYWKLNLPWETAAYVPKFYAAMLIMSDPGYYGFADDFAPPTETFEVALTGVVDLAQMSKQSGIDYGVVKRLNPEVLTKYSPPDVRPYALRMPAIQQEAFQGGFWSLPDDKKYLSTQKTAQLFNDGPPSGAEGSGRTRFVYHTVKSGESLWSIARKYRVSVNDLKRWNRSARGKYLSPGQRLKIKVRR